MLGAVLCVTVFPALVVLVNLGWVCGHAGWTSLRLAPLLRFQPWLQHLMGYATAEVDGDRLEGSLTFGRMAWVFFPTMTRGLSPIFALLMFGGMWGWRKVWSRRDHQPLFVTAVVILLAIWIQLWYDKIICPRYALPIVLMGATFAALGAGPGGAALAAGPTPGPRPAPGLVVAAAVLAAAVCLTDAMTSNTRYFEVRRAGRPIRPLARGPPRAATVVGPADIAPIVSYYVHHSPCFTFAFGATDASILSLVDGRRAEMVLLRPERQLTAERCASLQARLLRSGLGPLPGEMPAEIRSDLQVLVRVRDQR